LVLQERVEKLYAAADTNASDALQIMTIHKSKGLEFDHVILPGLDRRGGNDEKRLLAWLERPSDEVAESELMIAPIKETGSDKDDEITEYLNRVEQEKSRHESQRLLYVAATRAKKKLHLSFTLAINEKTGEPKSPAKSTLLGLLWPVIKDDVVVNFNDDVLDKVSEVTNCFIRKLDYSKVKTKDLSPLDYQHDSKTEFRPQTNLIEFDWASDLAAAVGTVCHQWMQILGESGSVDAHAYQEVIQQQLVEAGVLPKKLELASQRVSEILSHCLQDNRGQWVLNNQHEESQFEWGLSGVVNGAVMQCRLDRTFVDDGKRWIIDYKTSRHDDDTKDSFLDAEVIRYKSQLETYARLMSALDSRPIMLGLYYPAFGGWRSWEFVNE